MGLDIGVVQINYLPRPDKPAYDFAWHLNINDDEADWNGSSSTFVEYTRETLQQQLDSYITENRLPQSDIEELRQLGRRSPMEGRRDHATLGLVSWATASNNA